MQGSLLDVDGGLTYGRDKARAIGGRFCVSGTLMQEIFGVSRQTLGNWTQNGCPKVEAGWYPLADVIAWRGLAGTETGDDPEDDEPQAGTSRQASKQHYDTEYKRLQAEALEMRNAISRGDFVSRKEVVTRLSRCFTDIKRTLQGLSRKLATDVSPFVDPSAARRIESEISEEINKALTALADGDEYVPRRKRAIRG